MKNIILTTLLVTIASCLLAQNYLNETSTWRELEGCGPPGHSIKDLIITLDGDTLINGITYHRTYISELHRSSDGIGGDTTAVEDAYYSHPIREESGAFYYYKNGEDRMLHNFNLSVGDTVRSNYGDHYEIVENIDTVLIANTPRRRYFCGGAGNLEGVDIYLVEGVGSSFGLFYPPFWQNLLGDECGRYSKCFSQDDQHFDFKHFEGAVGCSNLVAVDDIEAPTFSFDISPNPTSDYINLEFGKTLNDIKIQIIDLTGRVLFSQHISNSNNIEKIDISNLPNGLFIVNVINNNVFESRKIIKH